MYFFVNPLNTERAEGSPEEVDWEFANKEIAQAKGFSTGGGAGLSKGVCEHGRNFCLSVNMEEIIV